MAENLMKVPAKGILKNSTSFEGSSASAECSTNRGGMKWDEMNILATHHPPDKDYGHMKIEEPKTPFSYQGEDSGDEGDRQELDSDLLVEKLMEDEKISSSFDCGIASEGSDDEEETPEERAKRKSFEHKRKAHYNEFMAVKLARQLMKSDEEDDDDDVKADNAQGSASKTESEILEDMDTKDNWDDKLPVAACGSSCVDMDIAAENSDKIYQKEGNGE